jgi:hypothetical protein
MSANVLCKPSPCGHGRNPMARCSSYGMYQYLRTQWWERRSHLMPDGRSLISIWTRVCCPKSPSRSQICVSIVEAQTSTVPLPPADARRWPLRHPNLANVEGTKGAVRSSTDDCTRGRGNQVLSSSQPKTLDGWLPLLAAAAAAAANLLCHTKWHPAGVSSLMRPLLERQSQSGTITT